MCANSYIIAKIKSKQEAISSKKKHYFCRNNSVI